MRYIALVVALAFAPCAHAWNQIGHMMVAAVAYPQLTPAARAQVDRLLQLNPSYAEWAGEPAAPNKRTAQRAFMLAATWADAIKGNPAYTDEGDAQDAPGAGADKGYSDPLRHRYWHYINVAFSSDGTPLTEARAPNVLTQIAAFSAVLADPAADADHKSYALVWLLHLVGDVHQPLHVVSRFTHHLPEGDAGGNKVQLLCPGGSELLRPASDGLSPVALRRDVARSRHRVLCAHNLHAFWDDLAGEEHLGEEARQANADLVPQALHQIRKLPKVPPQHAAVGDPEVWAKEGLMLAQTVVYSAPVGDGPGPYDIDEAYFARAHQVAQQQLAVAGARLARLLNEQLR
jgi:hypothetical protein